MNDILFFTTMHKAGFELYGNDWLESITKNVLSKNKNIKAVVYYENFTPPKHTHKNIKWLDFNKHITEHSKWKAEFIKQSRHGDGEKKRAIGFAYKSFVIQYVLDTFKNDYLIWTDGDVIFKNDSYKNFPNFLNSTAIACQVEENQSKSNSGLNHIESGIVIFDNKHPDTKKFNSHFKLNYSITNLNKLDFPYDGYLINQSIETSKIKFVNLNKDIPLARMVAKPDMTFMHPEIKRKFIHNIGWDGKIKYKSWLEAVDNDEVYRGIHDHQTNVIGRNMENPNMDYVILLGSFSENDGIGNSVLYLYESLKNNNYNVAVVSEWVEHTVKIPTVNLNDIEPLISKNTIIFYVHSHTINTFPELLKYNNKKICFYHNLTPPNLIPVKKAARNISMDIRNMYKHYNVFDHFICNSEYSVNELLKTFKKINKKNVSFIPPFTELKIKKMAYQTKQFLIVGRFTYHKNIESGLKLFKRINNIMPNSILNIIGRRGEEEYYNMLLNLINKYDLKHSIFFRENISDAELIQYYKNTTAHINDSQHEGFSLPTFESMYYGCSQFVCSGHAAEELLNSANLKSFNFKNIDSYTDEQILDYMDNNKVKDSEAFYKKYSELSDINNYINIVKKLK